MSSPQMQNPLDDLFGDLPPNENPSNLPVVIGGTDFENSNHGLDLDIDIDISDLEIDKQEPVTVTYHPVTGESVSLTDVADVIHHLIEIKSELQRLKEFENDLRRAALNLATGTTKTRRLSATVDGQLRTIEVHLPDDDWPERDLASLYAWCIETSRVTELGPFWRRFIRVKQKTEYSPVKMEVKKLANETFPEGSLLEKAKAKLLACNKGNSHKLPVIKIEGETLSEYEKKRFGDES